ncbi:MAG: aminoglycoside/choline kinase family phosphotransferase [bacterium]|jgi:aminoglycoside/choline kinase family phosphotransferase
MEYLEKMLNPLVTDFFQSSDFEQSLLKGDGSDRKIYRFTMKGKPPVIGVHHSDIQENYDFLFLTRHFQQEKIPVPAIYERHKDSHCYLLEDLGDYNLAEYLATWREQGDSIQIVEAYQKVLKWLPAIQTKGVEKLKDFFYDRVMDSSAYQTDITYFKKEFIGRTNHEQLLTPEVNAELDTFVERLSKLEPKYLVYRDFQSRNIMWQNQSPFFIDYQSAMLGSLHYDLASMLYASRAYLTEEERVTLIKYYLDISESTQSLEKFLEEFYLFVLIRRIRSLGSYAFLSLAKQKAYFFPSIEPTLEEIIGLLSNLKELSGFSNLLKMMQTIHAHWGEQADALEASTTSA